MTPIYQYTEEEEFDSMVKEENPFILEASEEGGGKSQRNEEKIKKKMEEAKRFCRNRHFA